MKLSNVLPVVLACSLSNAVAGLEWAGTFATNDPVHIWLAQKTGGSYVDPSMRIVFYAVSDPSDIDATIHKYEDEAEALIDSTDSSCEDVTSGMEIDLPTTGKCYTLIFDQTSDDTKFPMNTAGLDGFVAFGQHVPIEFERDMHYLKDSTGTDIEAILEEGSEGHSHSHGDHEETSGKSCACAAKEYKFNIDCTATAAMLDAMAFLKNAGCASDCSPTACETNYLIVQAHHDYCPEDKIPQEVEDGFHDYDTQCTACDISRAFIDGAPNCPAPKCDNSGDEAYASLVDLGCLSDCTSTACRDNFFVLRVEHDLCPHDALSKFSEDGLHDMEEPCAQQLCNIEGAEKTFPVCKEEDMEPESKNESGAATSTVAITVASAALIGAALI
uniref:Spondin domain-containing protein n=1 Tax=Odontella aurita TaxID=265563 RepID=A0A6U6G742_9STRA|mmetsp:Transcript_38309/g.114708  ORF Transcript_38309/g.114708 Transcript_38309/m.114708 type:complete len:386 (+) Transcript_38309:110-1267(+)